MKKLILDRVLTEDAAYALRGKFLDEEHIKVLITEDCDGYNRQGELLFKFRKNVIPLDILKLGVDSFKDSVQWTESRGLTSGSSSKRIRKDGSVSNITVGAKVESGVAGFLDEAAMIPYCRKTAFTSKYFTKYKKGLPFVEKIDQLYKELVPDKYAIQKQYAEGTNKSWVIGDTSFTTITINRDFRTAAHYDSGDLESGFGNLIAYREGDWTGCYTMMPEYGVGFDLQNGDIAFFDVHKLHCNTGFENFDKDTCVRYSFVLYYRQFMLACKSPSKELERIKLEKNGFFRL